MKDWVLVVVVEVVVSTSGNVVEKDEIDEMVAITVDWRSVVQNLLAATLFVGFRRARMTLSAAQSLFSRRRGTAVTLPMKAPRNRMITRIFEDGGK